MCNIEQCGHLTCFQGEKDLTVELFDRDKKGLMSYVEKLKLGMNNILFRKYDRDGDGLISAEELQELNLDGVGRLKFDEFTWRWTRPSGSAQPDNPVETGN